MKSSRIQPHTLLGLFVILFGVLALADNQHWFSTYEFIQFWPTVFIIMGALKITQTRAGSGYIMGGALIALGLLMTLSNFGLRSWWPLFIIVAGVAVILKGLNQSKSGDPSSSMQMKDTNIEALAFMGGNNLNVISQDWQGGEATAVMGGVEIDLRQASIQTEAVLQVFVIWGGIVLKVPPDWTIVSRGIPIMAGIADKTIPPMEQKKKLVIEGYVLMGGVEIKN